MASFSAVSLSSRGILIRMTSSEFKDDNRVHKPGKSSVRVNGMPSSVAGAAVASAPVLTSTPKTSTLVQDITREETRQNVPTEKQTADPFRQGVLTHEGVGYRQTAVVRSYEVGADKTATLETIFNLLQETALNHVWMSGLLGDGFGATHGMMRNNLIWVVARMHARVDEYPIWGEVVDFDTWVGASGKNGMRRDWLIRSHHSGRILARATSTWVMMNRKTRRLSKMPEEVKAEIEPWFIQKRAIEEEEDATEKIIKLDDDAKYIDSDLKAKRTDLDMNHHVNNVKYVKWLLETFPDEFMEDHQLSSIVLEYKRECSSSDIVQSVCEPDEDSFSVDDDEDGGFDLVKGLRMASDFVGDRLVSGSLSDQCPTTYTHLLQVKGKEKNEEIVRGRTAWKKKKKT